MSIGWICVSAMTMYVLFALVKPGQARDRLSRAQVRRVVDGGGRIGYSVGCWTLRLELGTGAREVVAVRCFLSRDTTSFPLILKRVQVRRLLHRLVQLSRSSRRDDRHRLRQRDVQWVLSSLLYSRNLTFSFRSRNRRRPPRLCHHRPTCNRHPRRPPDLRRSSKHRRDPFPRPPQPLLDLDSLGRSVLHLRGVACEGSDASDGEGGVCDVS